MQAAKYIYAKCILWQLYQYLAWLSTIRIKPPGTRIHSYLSCEFDHSFTKPSNLIRSAGLAFAY